MLHLLANKPNSFDMEDVRLHIHIENTEPIELLDLTSSLVSLSNQYTSYLKKPSTQNISSDAKLYVKEIRQGSTILELVEFAGIAVLPFLEDTNTIIGFAQYCKQAFNYFLGKEKDNPGISIADCREIANMVNPIVADHNSVMSIGTVVQGDLNITIQVSDTEANAIQNAAKREIARLKSTGQTDIQKKVLMTWEQASGNIKNNTKNRGVIDSIYSGIALKVLFEDEETKRKMLYGDDNPFTCVYEVDVRVETSQNKPVAYRIMKLHDMFEA